MRIQTWVAQAASIMCIATVASATAPQKFFVISNHVDPKTTTGMTAMANAKFNVRGGFLSNSGSRTSNIQYLQLSQGIIGAFVEDNLFGNPYLNSGGTEFQKMVSAYSPYSPFGYSFGDEPLPGAQQNLIIKNVGLLKSASPSAFTYVNLNPIGGAWGEFVPNSWCHNDPASCESQFETYVDEFFKSQLDAISFDLYVLYDNNPDRNAAYPFVDARYPIKYDSRNAAYPKFYYTNQLFAQKAKQYGKYFWAYGLSSDSHVFQQRCYALDNCVTEDIHYPKPILETARYYVGAGLAYGATGMKWFTYENPAINDAAAQCSPSFSGMYCYSKAPSDDVGIYNTISFVNEELNNSGSLMMSMKWNGTYHGSSIDPFSGEQNLPTITGNLSAILTNMQSDAMDNIAVGRFQSFLGKEILIFFNKSLTNPTSFSAQLTNLGSDLNIQRFMKNNRRWESVGLGSNKFGLTIAPGDYEIVVVNDANSRVIGSTSGVGTQTRAIFNANDITFLIGKLDGTFSTAIGKGQSSTYTVGNNGKDFLEGDFNGDGKMDLVHLITNGNIARIWYSDASGMPNHLTNAAFTPWNGYGVGTADQYLNGDFDGDGKDDLIHLCGSYVNIWRGNGSNGFSVISGWKPFQGYAFSMDKSRYKVADFNGDNRSDFLVVTDGNNGNNYYRIFSGQVSATIPFGHTNNQYLLHPNGTDWVGYYITPDVRLLHIITGDQNKMADLAWWPAGQKSHIWTSLGTKMQASKIRP